LPKSKLSDASFPNVSPRFPESFGTIDEACSAGANGGPPLADFIQMSTLHAWVCFTRETGKELLHQ
jgi:hypothetical protein